MNLGVNNRHIVSMEVWDNMFHRLPTIVETWGRKHYIMPKFTLSCTWEIKDALKLEYGK